MRRKLAATLALALTAAALASAPVQPVDATSHASAATATASASNPYAFDPVASIAGLARKGDALGWHIPSGAPQPSQCKHWQGVARSIGFGTPYLFVTRNSNAGICVGQDDEVGGDLSVVELATREPYGERLRSNRLKKDTDIVDTAPPRSDRVVHHVRFDGSPVVGDDETWPHYEHPGGVQLVGDVLAVALEGPKAGGPTNAVVFVDVSNPLQPTILSRMDAGHADDHIAGIPDSAWGAGLAALTPLADGRYLLLLTGKDNKLLRMFVSRGTDLRAPDLAWDHLLDVTEATIESQIGPDWPAGDVTGDAHQMLNFVRTGPDDSSELWLVGGRNTQPSSAGGEDWVDLYQVSVDVDAAQFAIEHRASRHVDTHATLTDGTAGSGNIASFKAASGVHVSPTGELVVYATEHDNTGPEVDGVATVNAGEWRYRRMTRDDSPTFDPTPFANGPYSVPEGATVQLHGTADPPRTKAWLELYADPDFGARSAVIDYPDFHLDSWDDFDQLDGETTDPDNFSDDPSSVRWFSPVGCVIRLNDDDYGDDDFPGDVVVHLPSGPNPQEIADLGGADGSITSVSFLEIDPSTGEHVDGCSRYYDAPLSIEWDLDRDGSHETAAADAPFSAATLDGPTTVSVPLRAVHPMDGRTGHAAAAVAVTNVAPSIVDAAALDPAGAEIGVDVPVAVIGLPVTVEATFTDPGVADSQTASIDWGDGTVTASTGFDVFSDARGGAVGELSHAHPFAAAGTHQITLEVVDDDGGATATTIDVEVLSIEDALGLVVDGIDEELAATVDARARRALSRARDAIVGEVSGLGADGAVDHLEDGNLVAAMVKLGEALDALGDAALEGADVAAIVHLVTVVANAVAQGAYLDARAAASPPTPSEQRRLEDVEAALAAGVSALVAGEHAVAVDAFTDAVRHAESLCGCR